MPFQPQEPTSNNHNSMQEETLVETRAYHLYAHVKLKGELAFTYRAGTGSKDLQVPNRIVINPLFLKIQKNPYEKTNLKLD